MARNLPEIHLLDPCIRACAAGVLKKSELFPRQLASIRYTENKLTLNVSACLIERVTLAVLDPSTLALGIDQTTNSKSRAGAVSNLVRAFHLESSDQAKIGQSSERFERY